LGCARQGSNRCAYRRGGCSNRVLDHEGTISRRAGQLSHRVVERERSVSHAGHTRASARQRVESHCGPGTSSRWGLFGVRADWKLTMEATTATAPPPVGFFQTRRGRWLVIVTVTVGFAIIGLVAFGYWYFFARNYQDTDDAYVAGDLVNVMSQVNGTVVSIGADETDLVEAGQELVRLDNTDAEIALRDAEARLARAVRQTRTVFANRDQLQAVVAQRRADLRKAQSDLERRKDLTRTGAVSAEEVSHAQDALSAARDGLVAAQKNLAASAALTGQTGVPDNPDVQAAATDVERSYLAVRRTRIHAPVS